MIFLVLNSIHFSKYPHEWTCMCFTAALCLGKKHGRTKFSTLLKPYVVLPCKTASWQVLWLKWTLSHKQCTCLEIRWAPLLLGKAVQDEAREPERRFGTDHTSPGMGPNRQMPTVDGDVAHAGWWRLMGPWSQHIQDCSCHTRAQWCSPASQNNSKACLWGCYEEWMRLWRGSHASQCLAWSQHSRHSSVITIIAGAVGSRSNNNDNANPDSSLLSVFFFLTFQSLL